MNHDNIMKKDGFRIVKKRRRIKNNKQRFYRRKFPVKVNRSQAVITKNEKFQKGEFIKEMSEYRRMIRCSLDVERLKNSVFKSFHCEEIVCYGIGDLLTSKSAKVQFCLLDLLSSRIDGIESLNKFIFDPVIPRNCSERVFRDFKKFLRKRYNMKWIDVNENCKRITKCPTLFYMPHGDLWMYENVMVSNADHLNQVKILGNDFRAYEEKKKKFGDIVKENFHKQRYVEVEKDVEYEYGLNDFYSHSFG